MTLGKGPENLSEERGAWRLRKKLTSGGLKNVDDERVECRKKVDEQGLASEIKTYIWRRPSRRIYPKLAIKYDSLSQLGVV